MQAYSEGFARIYNARWNDFANYVAPLILGFYAGTPIGQENMAVLDLCCGTGQLAVHFLQAGYRVVGLDLSEPMLRYARENARQVVDSGQARFVHGDASDFTLDQRFGLVVSTYDSLNHLESEEALRKCFQCVSEVNLGLFIFDLNTRAGLNRWNTIRVDDGDQDVLMITHGIYDGQSDRAWTRITGFARRDDGLYERFEETVFNTVFQMERVRKALLEVGYRDAYFARVQDLETPIAEPEEEGRVFIIASKVAVPTMNAAWQVRAADQAEQGSI
jgi:SAM-dependent methyltransferase